MIICTLILCFTVYLIAESYIEYLDNVDRRNHEEEE